MQMGLKIFQLGMIVTVILIYANGYLSYGQSQPQQQKPGDGKCVLSDDDTVMIAEAYHLWESLGDFVWSGWTDVDMAFLYITKEWDIAIGFNDTLDGFELADDKMVAGRSVQFRVREQEMKQAAAHDFQGIECIIMGTPENLEWSRTKWVMTAEHEMYHVMSAARGSVAKVSGLEIEPDAVDASWQLDFPFPYQDADVMRLMHLQGYPIYLAVTVAEPFDADEEVSIKYNAGTAMEALAVLKSVLRARTGDDRAYNYAKFQEGEEGIAKYTEYKIAELAGGMEGYVPLEGFEKVDGYISYKELWESAYIRMPFVIKHSGRAAKNRIMFYFMGAGKALLLDRIKPDWKDNYFAPNVWLDDLIMDAI